MKIDKWNVYGYFLLIVTLLFICSYVYEKGSRGKPLPDIEIKELRPGSSGRIYVLLVNGEIYQKLGDDRWVKE